MASSRGEEDFLRSLSSSIDPWLGITDALAEDELFAFTGETLPAAPPFHQGEPNDVQGQDCMILFTSSADVGWGDDACLTTHDTDDIRTTAICEAAAGSVGGAGTGNDAFCGDGVVYPAFGETCDDGNRLDGDACAADCGASTNAAVEIAAEIDVPRSRLFVGYRAARTFNNAAFVCGSLGGTLAIPDGLASQEMVARIGARLGGDVWIGYSDSSDEAFGDDTRFRRVDTGDVIGEGFEGFEGAQPDANGFGEDCVEMQLGGAWNDTECNQSNAFVCMMWRDVAISSRSDRVVAARRAHRCSAPTASWPCPAASRRT